MKRGIAQMKKFFKVFITTICLCLTLAILPITDNNHKIQVLEISCNEDNN